MRAAIEELTYDDEDCAKREVGVVGFVGPSAAYTGEECFPWAGGYIGEHFACQGNILVGEDTVLAMARTFVETPGLLCDRLIASLAAGQEAGGDSRGQQSAALLVVREKGGYEGFNDRFIDLRVDDHTQPIDELQRILQLHKLYLFPTNSDDILDIDQKLAVELQERLTISGDYQGNITGSYDERTRDALRKFSGRENLEERWFEDSRIDRIVLEFMRQHLRK